MNCISSLHLDLGVSKQSEQPIRRISPDLDHTPGSYGGGNIDIYSVMSPRTSHAQSVLRANSSLSQWEITDPVSTLSETSFNQSLLDDGDNSVESTTTKLSFWAQCTIAKCSLGLEVNQDQKTDFSKETPEDLIVKRQLLVELEDLTTSLDYQDVFSKMKLKLGSFSVNHYVKDRLVT